NEIRKIGHENVYVLGAKDADTLHVLTMDAEEPVSGYIALDAVSWTDNLRSARVNAEKPSGTVKLREEPSTSSDILCRLYTGTSVNLMFDWHTVGNEWSKVRVGSVTGYMMNRYLDYSSGGTSRYIPRPALITAQEAPVTGSAAVGSVDQNTPLFILGIKGSGKEALYLCEGSTWITEQKYKSFYGWIQAGYLPYDSKNPCTAVSHIARLKRETPIDQIRDRKVEQRAGVEGGPDSFAAGKEVLILGGLDSELGSVTGNYYSEYLTEDTTWVMVSVETEKYHFLECILPIDALDYDQGLMLPWQFTNG
ncbi:MAG: SH3 domain-containing protein, partial [Clostridia bacterium]|nr:SH3 domain-containing protein [Clostridia bacterium]